MFVRIVLVPLVDSRHPKWYEHALDIARVNDDNVDGIWHPTLTTRCVKAEWAARAAFKRVLGRPDNWPI